MLNTVITIKGRGFVAIGAQSTTVNRDRMQPFDPFVELDHNVLAVCGAEPAVRDRVIAFTRYYLENYSSDQRREFTPAEVLELLRAVDVESQFQSQLSAACCGRVPDATGEFQLVGYSNSFVQPITRWIEVVNCFYASGFKGEVDRLNQQPAPESVPQMLELVRSFLARTFAQLVIKPRFSFMILQASGVESVELSV